MGREIELESYPHISVVIPTCNRPTDVQRALNSLTNISYPSWDILVVDQSDNALTKAIVEAARSNLPYLRYRHIQAKGVSRARNLGIQLASGKIIAFLDDDCTVKPDWLEKAIEVFRSYPHAAHVYGAVVPPDGTSEWTPEGWTPTNDIKTECEVRASDLRSRIKLPRLLGMGACLFVRHDVAVKVGFFDVHQGGGARFQSFEDGDYTYRTYRAGFSFVRTPTIKVEHYGFRDYQSGAASRWNRAYVYGAGSWMVKAVRAGDLFAFLWIAQSLWSYLRMMRPLEVLKGHRRTGTAYFVVFVRGMIDSLALGVDRRHGLYRARSIRR